MSDYKECGFANICKKVDPTDPLCYEMGGKLGDKSRPECYKQMSIKYRVARFAKRQCAKVFGELAYLILQWPIKGAIKEERIDED